jgi:hypothetical protein
MRPHMDQLQMRNKVVVDKGCKPFHMPLVCMDLQHRVVDMAPDMVLGSVLYDDVLVLVNTSFLRSLGSCLRLRMKVT